MRDGMSQRLEYRSLCPDRLTPRYILDRQTRRRQREFHRFLLTLGCVVLLILMLVAVFEMVSSSGW
jgi:hypothetical protein